MTANALIHGIRCTIVIFPAIENQLIIIILFVLLLAQSVHGISKASY